MNPKLIKKRHVFQTVKERCEEQRRFIQVLYGPRQIGKTTLIDQVMNSITLPSHYASADKPTLQDTIWLEQQWELARRKINNQHHSALLVLDEIQKIPHWSDYVKALWDEDTKNKTQLKVVILGSAPLLIQKGLSESLAGRFEVIPMTHWHFDEMHEAFGVSLDQYIYFGGYPGAAQFIQDQNRWASYIYESLIETTISRDILLLNRIDKPALLRRLFELGCHYSSQILSYQKMLGQLQEGGNATTLAHYLDLLSGAGILTGLQKYSGKTVRQKASSPKLQALNTALISAQSALTFEEAKKDPVFWGRLVESAVGSNLINRSIGSDIKVYYWRERNKEVDFILQKGKNVTAIEVKSHLKKEILSGMTAFNKAFNPQKKLLVGAQGIPLEEFLSSPIEEWVK